MKGTCVIIILLASVSLMAMGCKKNQCEVSDLNGALLPDECYDCDWHAPEGVEISWNEYNTVSEVCTYFNGHRETLREHEGDTVNIVGWVCRMDSVNSQTWRVVLADYPHDVELGMGSDVIYMFLITSSENAHMYYDNKVYVKCIVGTDIGLTGHPCYYSLKPQLVSIDTVDNLK